MLPSFTMTSSVGASLPPNVARLAEALAALHGDVQIARESKGLHIYLACPACLQEKGRKELSSRHFAINVDKFLGLGKFQHSFGTYDREASGYCMRAGHRFGPSQLLAMPPIASRGIQWEGQGRVAVASLDRWLVDDGRGNMIPPPAGEVIPITGMPPDHPSVWYLRNRNYDLEMLWRHMRCGYCLVEFPENQDKNLIYPSRGYSSGWKDTPQSRIIFHGDVMGVQTIWQGRYLERELADRKEAYHPYRRQWEMTHRVSGWDQLTGKPSWELVFPYDDIDPRKNKPRWEPAKYRTAKFSSRNETVIGYDASVREASSRSPGHRWVVVTEGPLDAGRFGPPAVAVMGKSVSPAQARLLAMAFDHVIVAFDADAAGLQAKASLVEAIRPTRLSCGFLPPPGGLKDWGEAPPNVAAAWLADYLKKHGYE